MEGGRRPAIHPAAPGGAAADAIAVRRASVDELAAWKAERRRRTAPARYLFGVLMGLSVAASFLLPDGPGLVVRAILFAAGLAILTLGRRSTVASTGGEAAGAEEAL